MILKQHPQLQGTTLQCRVSGLIVPHVLSTLCRCSVSALPNTASCPHSAPIVLAHTCAEVLALCHLTCLAKLTSTTLVCMRSLLNMHCVGVFKNCEGLVDVREQ